MKKFLLTVATVAMFVFVGYTSYKLVPDIFGEKTEVFQDNTLTVKDFLKEYGVTAKDGEPKNNWVYKNVIASNREQYKNSASDYLYSSNKGEKYFLFYK